MVLKNARIIKAVSLTKILTKWLHLRKCEKDIKALANTLFHLKMRNKIIEISSFKVPKEQILKKSRFLKISAEQHQRLYLRREESYKNFKEITMMMRGN